jgi:hypothetical protein
MCEQSPSPMQAAQAWAPTLQRLALTLVQSVLASHCTQALPKQAGVPPLQSLRFSHWTHALPTHAGVPPLQSLRFSHCTQSFATQAGRSGAAVQSARSSQRTTGVGAQTRREAGRCSRRRRCTATHVVRLECRTPGPAGRARAVRVSYAHSTHVTPSSTHAGVARRDSASTGPRRCPRRAPTRRRATTRRGRARARRAPARRGSRPAGRNASGGPASIPGPAASMSMQRPSISSVPEGHSAEPHPATASRAMRRRRTSLT